jgi:hypothetical protein
MNAGHRLMTGDGQQPVRYFTGPPLCMGVTWGQNLGRQHYRHARWCARLAPAREIALGVLSLVAVAAAILLSMCL